MKTMKSKKDMKTMKSKKDMKAMKVMNWLLNKMSLEVISNSNQLSKYCQFLVKNIYKRCIAGLFTKAIKVAMNITGGGWAKFGQVR